MVEVVVDVLPVAAAVVVVLVVVVVMDSAGGRRPNSIMQLVRLVPRQSKSQLLAMQC